MSRLLQTGLCLVAMLVIGCGELGADYKGLHPVRPATLSEEDIARYAAGSPARTVLDWFRVLQRSDASRAAAFYDPALGVSSRSIVRQRASAATFFNRFTLRRVLDVSRHGSWATVFAELNSRLQAPNGRAVEIRVPQAFTVVSTQRGWRLADSSFLGRAKRLVVKVTDR